MKRPGNKALHQGVLKYGVLILAVSAMMGSYWCFDVPSALKRPLTEAMSLSETQYNFLYSIDAFPNLILPVVAGVFVDSLGVQRTLLSFLALLCVAQFLVALAIPSSYWLTVVGRLLFGMGAEALSVAQNTFLASWFDDSGRSFAMGLNLSVSRLGTVLNYWVSPILFENYGLSAAVWFGLLVCVLCFLLECVVVAIDRFANASPTREADPLLSAKSTSVNSTEAATTDSLLDDSDVALSMESQQQQSSSAEQPFSCSEFVRDVLELPRAFWLLCLSIVCFYSAYLPFLYVAEGFFESKYGLPLRSADFLLAVPNTLAVIGTSLCGFFADKVGNRARLMILSSFTLASVHLVFAVTDVSPLIPIVIMGLSYVTFGAVSWPAISRLVTNKARTGTAYGITASVQNVGLFLVPLLVGTIKDRTGSDAAVEQLFLWIAVGAIALTTWLSRTEEGSLLNEI